MITDELGSRYYESLDKAKVEGYSPVKATSPLCFFSFRGKTTKLIAENLEITPALTYCVLGTDNKYYVKDYRGYDLDTFFFYRPTLTFSGEDVSVENLRRYIDDNRVWILFTQAQVENVSNTLKRLFKSQLSGEGKVPYPIYIKLLEESLRYEDYKVYGCNLIGFKTACKGFEDRIEDLWKRAYEKARTI